MRFWLVGFMALVLAGPVAAQQISPMTGTTDSAPSAPAEKPAAGAAGRPHRAARMGLQKRFEAANTTHDGKLTLEQAQEGHMPQIAKNFDAIDTKHRGYVTVAEIKSYRKAARAARKAGKAS